MVNSHDPNTILLDSLAFVKLSHTLGGLYIWEFVTTLDFEWRIVRGRVPYRWTTWIYSLARLATLMAVIINIVTLDVTTQTNCQVWITFKFVFAFCTYAFSSLLIILRIIAIWNWNKGIVGLAVIIMGTNISFLIHGITRARSSWIPETSRCSLPNVKSNTATFVSTFITDFVLLVIMLFGLLRLRRRGGGMFGLGRLLWKQGILWLLLATLAELPPVVFIYLDLNVAFDVMFVMPSLITMAIAATRMYRSLADFCSIDIVGSDDPPRRGPAVPKPTSTFIVSIPPRQVEVDLHTTHEKYPSSLRDENVLYIDGDHSVKLQCDKEDEHTSSCCQSDDIESGVSK